MTETNVDFTWKARFIVTQDGGVDLPPDRQHVEGPTEPKARIEFLDQLSDAVPSPALFEVIASKLKNGEINTREAGEVVLFDITHEGDRWLVRGNTNASAGYFYVEARRRPPNPNDITPGGLAALGNVKDPWYDTLNEIEAKLEAMSESDRNDAIEALRSRFNEIYTRDLDHDPADDDETIDKPEGDSA